MIFFQCLPLTVQITADGQLRVVLRLYRAVSEDELADLSANAGTFRDSIHKTAEKGFFFSQRDADSLGRWCTEDLGAPHKTVCTDAPVGSIERGRPHRAAQEGPGVYLSAVEFDKLTPAFEVE